MQSVLTLLLLLVWLTDAAYQVKRCGAADMRTVSSFLCKSFMDEGVIDNLPDNLARHIFETEQQLLKYQAFNGEDGFKTCLFKAVRDKSDLVGAVEIFTDGSSPRRAMLQNLVVALKYRRLGIGALLVGECCSVVASEWGMKSLWLNVEDDNEAALKFYKKLGFVLEDDSDSSDSDDSIGFGSKMMRKTL